MSGPAGRGALGVRGWVLTVGGLGLLRPGPGTWGSLPPVVLGMVLAALLPRAGVVAGLLLLALAASIACVRFGTWAEAQWGRRDPSAVVADEVAGMSLPLLLVPWQAGLSGEALRANLALAGGAFLLFRILDIAKPPPVRQAERAPGGWGVLLDDLVAGAIAAALLAALLAIWPIAE